MHQNRQTPATGCCGSLGSLGSLYSTSTAESCRGTSTKRGMRAALAKSVQLKPSKATTEHLFVGSGCAEVQSKGYKGMRAGELS